VTDRLRVVLMSNDAFGYNAGEAILASDRAELVGLVTDSDHDMAGFCRLDQHFRVPVHVVGKKLNTAETVEFIDCCVADVVLSCGWSRIVGKRILAAFPVIGMHPTMLPHGRGCAPVVWSILDAPGGRESAVSFFWMTDEIDGGDLVYQHPFLIGPGWRSSDLYARICGVVADAVPVLIDRLFVPCPVPASDDDGEYWSKRTPDMSQIDWFASAEEVALFVRALSWPYPEAFSYYGEEVVRFLDHSVVVSGASGFAPGVVVRTDPFAFDVAAADGVVTFLRKMVDTRLPLSVGDIFGRRCDVRE